MPAPSARAGDALLARVTVSVPSDQYYVVVEDPFPAGMEPIDGSLLTAPTGMPPDMLAQAQTDRVGWRWWYFTRAEMRDDRLVLFADALPAGTYQYTYLLTAALPGSTASCPPGLGTSTSRRPTATPPGACTPSSPRSSREAPSRLTP